MKYDVLIYKLRFYQPLIGLLLLVLGVVLVYGPGVFVDFFVFLANNLRTVLGFMFIVVGGLLFVTEEPRGW